MIAHRYAQQNEERGKTSNGNLFFEGKTIYSYGYHFPIAHIINDGLTLFNSESYSVSTAKHQSDVHSALRGGLIINMDTGSINGIKSIDINKSRLNRGDCRFFNEYTKNEVKGHLNSATKRRKASLKEQDISYAIDTINNAILFYDAIKKPSWLPKEILKLRDKLNGDVTDILKHHGEALKREAKAKLRAERKAQKARKAKQLEELAKFRNGEAFSSYQMGGGVALLRVKGDVIQTSQGAEFPISHAKKAFKVILKCVKAGKGWTNDGNQDIRLGHCNVDFVTSKGLVRAGCHDVEYSEIESIAKQLELIK